MDNLDYDPTILTTRPGGDLYIPIGDEFKLSTPSPPAQNPSSYHMRLKGLLSSTIVVSVGTQRFSDYSREIITDQGTPNAMKHQGSGDREECRLELRTFNEPS
ncbi:hypothetical protein L6452_04110 [Arctium lappa]|uniref:Uncharacterized protein n=1 Tax=Arctium lappa TaxID=4217 RepID=A0ACB9FQ34_ARCLA|nr:hypothetical protein L6452_04110 [Arctium lappa]